MKPIDAKRFLSAILATVAASSLSLMIACGNSEPPPPVPETVNVVAEANPESTPETSPAPTAPAPMEEVPEGLPEKVAVQGHSDALKAFLSSLSTAERERPNPYSSDQNGNGAKDYLELCAPCHGETGRGDGPAAAALNGAPTNLVPSSEGASLRPGELFSVVQNGIPGTHMQGFGMARSEAQIWQILAHIDSFR
jgi:mono/diheme cytochrome c family protein